MSHRLGRRLLAAVTTVTATTSIAVATSPSASASTPPVGAIGHGWVAKIPSGYHVPHNLTHVENEIKGMHIGPSRATNYVKYTIKGDWTWTPGGACMSYGNMHKGWSTDIIKKSYITTATAGGKTKLVPSSEPAVTYNTPKQIHSGHYYIANLRTGQLTDVGPASTTYPNGCGDPGAAGTTATTNVQQQQRRDTCDYFFWESCYWTDDNTVTGQWGWNHILGWAFGSDGTANTAQACARDSTEGVIGGYVVGEGVAAWVSAGAKIADITRYGAIGVGAGSCAQKVIDEILP